MPGPLADRLSRASAAVFTSGAGPVGADFSVCAGSPSLDLCAAGKRAVVRRGAEVAP